MLLRRECVESVKQLSPDLVAKASAQGLFTKRLAGLSVFGYYAKQMVSG
jgi:hypothetical protein